MTGYDLRIIKDGTDVTKETVTVIVGQKIALTAKIENAVPDGATYKWTVPGDRVKSYTVSLDLGKKEPLADLEKKDIAFYWINKLNDDVSVSAVLGGQTKTVKATFKVLRPELTRFFGKTTISNPPIAIDNTGLPGVGTSVLHFGTKISPGISWFAVVRAPLGGTGEIAITQLIKSERTRTIGSMVQTRSSFEYVLDDPDEKGRIQAVGPKAIDSDAFQTLGPLDKSNDSPYLPVARTRHVSATDVFKTYLVYRPDPSSSIWVTLQKLEWFWVGSGTKRFLSIYTLDAGSTDYARDPVGENSIELPEWDGRFAELLWTPPLR